jgi:hypothetical protein
MELCRVCSLSPSLFREEYVFMHTFIYISFSRVLIPTYSWNIYYFSRFGKLSAHILLTFGTTNSYEQNICIPVTVDDAHILLTFVTTNSCEQNICIPVTVDDSTYFAHLRVLRFYITCAQFCCWRKSIIVKTMPAKICILRICKHHCKGS